MAVSELLVAARTALDPPRMRDVEALVQEAGWNQVAADWRIFLELGRVHAAHDRSGRIVAAAATLPFRGFGWISMVLVAGEHRRQGLATHLMHRCIDELSSSGCVPVLDATPAGRTVYRALGFQDGWGFHRLERHDHRPLPVVPQPPAGVALRPIDQALWQNICDYDCKVFGADRGSLLSRLRGRLPVAAELCAMQDGRVVGFGLGRNGRLATQIGPIVADDEATAAALLARALAAVAGPVFIDLVDGKYALRGLLDETGFVPQRPFTRMLLGRSTCFDDGRRTFAVVGPEFG
jgi:GNAT superfamily N-acetyltransferase